mgnify:CR=1 FL=1
MINGIRLKDKDLSPNQRRIRLMELGGIPISDQDKKRLEPRKELLNEVGMMLPVREQEVIGKVKVPMGKNSNIEMDVEEHDWDLEEFISELESELDLDDILREMGYYDEEDELVELHDVKVSKGYKEGRKLEDKLRRELFRKLNDDELEDFMDVLKTSFGLK